MAIRNSTSRNKTIILNTIVVLFMTILNVVLGMAEIKLLISTFGPVVNGVMQTGNQLLSYVALIEAGIGAAFLYQMYEPVSKNDMSSLSSLYCGFSISMRKVVVKMMVFAIFVSIVYPFLLSKDGISYLYIVSVFVLLSAKTILPYLLTIVPKNMIIVAEQRYKAEFITGACKAMTYFTEIILLLYTDWPLQTLLIVCVLMAFVSGLIFRIIMKSIFGNRIDEKSIPDLSPQKMSKDILAHNISGVAFNSTANILVSLVSLTAVTVYSNYNLIVSQVTMITQNITNGATASLGIKIANNDKNVHQIFREIFSATSWIACIIFSVFVVSINDFIELWVGLEYCISWYNKLMFGLLLFSGILSQGIIVARDAKGLYKESRNFTILQAVVNLCIAAVLLPFFGITGVLIGAIISRFAITIPMNYRLVYKKIFPTEHPRYFELLAAVCLSFVIIIGCNYLCSFLSFIQEVNFKSFVIKTIITTFIATIVSFVYYVLTDEGFTIFISRITDIIKRKIR